MAPAIEAAMQTQRFSLFVRYIDIFVSQGKRGRLEPIARPADNSYRAWGILEYRLHQRMGSISSDARRLTTLRAMFVAGVSSGHLFLEKLYNVCSRVSRAVFRTFERAGIKLASTDRR